MQNDLQDVLSAMLVDWHRYCQRRGLAGGYNGRAAGFGQTRSNSQFDWENGVESELVDKRIMKGFDEACERVREKAVEERRPEIFTALEFEAKNLSVRYAVWTSPRLPDSPIARQALVMEARNRLLRELAKDGVLL